MKKTSKRIYRKDGQDRLLPRFSLFIFDRSRTAAVVWLCLTVFGIFSYTTLLKREGFPSINIPYSVIGGSYFVNDPQKVDAEVTRPISDIVLKDPRVKSVQASAQGMFYHVAVQYEEGTDAPKAVKEIERRIKDAGFMPKQATIEVETPKIGFTERGDDTVISVYAKEDGATTQELLTEGKKLAKHIKGQKLPDVLSVSAIEPFIEGTNTTTGATELSQTHFDRYAQRVKGQNRFYDSVSVGIDQKDGTDVIKLDEKIQEAVASYNKKPADLPC